MKYLITLTLFISLVACRTTKHLTKQETKTDSVTVKNLDSVQVKKSDASTTRIKKVSVGKVEKKDRVITTIVEDYKLPDTIKAATIIRRTTVIDQDKGKVKTERTKTDTLHVKESTSDSTHKKGSDSVRLIKSELKKNVDVKKTQGGWMINVGFIIVLLLGLAIGIRYWLQKRIKNKLKIL